MGILNKHTDHKVKCPTCGDVYDLRYLDQVAKHMHTGIVIDETIKGRRVKKGKKK
jgi:C4-type Zn-finger protein